MEKLTPIKDENTGMWTLEGVEPWHVTYAKFIHFIKEGINFKFARYGDGELNCIFGKDGKNCDGHEYYNDLGDALKQSFNPEIITGIQPLSLTLTYADKVNELISELRLVNADVLHNASIDLRLSEILIAVSESGRQHVCVGPTHLTPMFDSMILIPDENCWIQHENIKRNLSEWIEENENGIIFLCASMMSEVLISDFRNANVTMIDAGSVFDPYVNVKSRNYHHKLPI